MNKPENPRAVAGDNALITKEYLDANFAKFIQATEGYEKQAAEAPDVLEDDDDLNIIVGLVNKGREAAEIIENMRVAVKQPFLDGERLVQAWFMALIVRIQTKQVELNTRGTRYKKKLEAAEQRKRDEEARIAKEKAEADRKAAEEAKQKANEAITAAVQNSANHAAAQRYTEEAAKAEAKAVESQHTMALAEIQKDVPISTVSRGSEGTSSLGIKWGAVIENRNLLETSLNLLAEHFTQEHLERAIRGYIRANKHLVGGTKTKLKDPDGKGGIPGVAIYDDSKMLTR